MDFFHEKIFQNRSYDGFLKAYNPISLKTISENQKKIIITLANNAFKKQQRLEDYFL